MTSRHAPVGRNRCIVHTGSGSAYDDQRGISRARSSLTARGSAIGELRVDLGLFLAAGEVGDEEDQSGAAR